MKEIEEQDLRIIEGLFHQVDEEEWSGWSNKSRWGH